jgi:hypothetical protein
LGVPKRRSLFVSFSVKSSDGASAPGAKTYHHRSPRCLSWAEVGQDVDRRRIRTPVHRRDPAQHVLLAPLRILDHHVEIPTLRKRRPHRVDQLVLRLIPTPTTVLLDERPVGVGHLRVLVEHLRVGVRRRRVEVEIVLLDVLAVVALVAGEPEEAFLEDRIVLVPEAEGEAEVLESIAEAAESVFVPAVGAAAGVVVGEIFPGLACGAIVFADGAPGAFAEVGSPVFPVGATGFGVGQALMFGSHRVVDGERPDRFFASPDGPVWGWLPRWRAKPVRSLLPARARGGRPPILPTDPTPGPPRFVQHVVGIVLQRLLAERGVPLADLKAFLALEVHLVPSRPVVGCPLKKVSVT